MTRWIITTLVASAITVLSAAPGCGATGVGDPCTPDDEYDPTFQGFSVDDVSVESKSYVCLTRLCLVNHFLGRVTCPWGQSAPNTGVTTPATGTPADTAGAQYGCGIPGAVADPKGSPPGYPVDQQITATNVSVGGSFCNNSACTMGQVPGQLTGAAAANRTANSAVYCSCRCANTAGNTDDGAVYCTCPSGYDCTQLVSSIGATDTGLTGAYCVQHGTQYDPTASTAQNCDPAATAQGQPGYCDVQY